MDASELRAAAERVADDIFAWLLSTWDVGHSVLRPQGDVYVEQVRDNFRGIAAESMEALLAGHAADDGDVAGIDWLNNLRRKGGNMSWLRVRLCDDGLHLMGMGPVSEGVEGLMDYVAPTVATKGDIRGLAKILGIDLIENAA